MIDTDCFVSEQTSEYPLKVTDSDIDDSPRVRAGKWLVPAENGAMTSSHEYD